MRARIGEQVTVRGVRGAPDRTGRVEASVANRHGTEWYYVRYNDDGTRSDRIPSARVTVYRIHAFLEFLSS
jgi:hypothetical protein